MAWTFARRLSQSVLLVGAIAVLSFALGELAPGSYDTPLRLDSQYSADSTRALRARRGLDDPLATRFLRWAASVARGDLGVSVEYETPVAPLVWARAGRTLLLGGAATGLAWLVAIPLGVWMAAQAGTWFDRAGRGALSAAVSVPEPVLALGLMLLAVRTGWAPAGGMHDARGGASSAWVGGVDVVRHMVLPVAVLVAGLLPPLTRHVRASVAAALQSSFITAARARGVPRRRLLFRSALRVAATPLVSLAGLSLANLLSASLLVEVITGWPGLGPLMVEATRSRDIPVVAGITLCSTAFLVLGRLAADLALPLCDPRIRLAPLAGGE